MTENESKPGKRFVGGHRSAAFVRYGILTGILWTAVLGGLFYWNLRAIVENTAEMARHETHSLFHEIVTARYWNASHGGVYVPVTETTQPNPYLDVPDRDIQTTDGRLLTKVNPAYMTRQLSELARERNQVWFHITSDKPIRPQNKPDYWEEAALSRFRAGDKNVFELVSEPGQAPAFRYMEPLWVEKPCLKCHAKQGYKEGDLRGGISVSTPAAPFLESRNDQILNHGIAYALILMAGLVGITLVATRLGRDEATREKMIRELSDALENVKTLSGLLPICSSCKKVRDDKGYWNKIEAYIQEHSHATVSHGICPECMKELYPEYADRVLNRKKEDS